MTKEEIIARLEEIHEAAVDSDSWSVSGRVEELIDDIRES